MADDNKPWINKSDKPATASWEAWGATPKGPGRIPGTEGSGKVFGLGGSVTGVANGEKAMVDAEAAIGGAHLEGTKSWQYGQVGGEMNVLYAKAEGHAGITQNGYGAQGEASAAMATAKVTGRLGNDQANVTGGLEGKNFYAEAKGQALLGDDGRYQGVALGGKAGAGVVSGTASGGVTVPIDWIPFVPKGWTIGVKGEAEAKAGAVEAAAGAYAYRDRADNRFHAGIFEGLSIGLGEFLAVDLSIGPSPMPPAPAPPKPEDFIRPMARVGDPVGAHSSNLGKWLLVAGLAVGLLLAWPAVLGAVATAGAITAAVGATGVAASAITGVVVGSAVVSAAAQTATLGSLGAKLGKLITFESGSPCSEILTGSPKTMCEGKAVARIGDKNSHGVAELKTGAERVIEGNGNVSRVKESSTCGGEKILKGASKTFVGSPSVSSGKASVNGDALLDKITGALDAFSENKWVQRIAFVGDFVSGGTKAMTKAGTHAVETAAVRTVAAETSALARAKAKAMAVKAVAERQVLTLGGRLAGEGTKKAVGRFVVGGAVEVGKSAAEDYVKGKVQEGTSYMLQRAGVDKEKADLFAEAAMAARDARKGYKDAREAMRDYGPKAGAECATCAKPKPADGGDAKPAHASDADATPAHTSETDSKAKTPATSEAKPAHTPEAEAKPAKPVTAEATPKPQLALPAPKPQLALPAPAKTPDHVSTPDHVTKPVTPDHVTKPVTPDPTPVKATPSTQDVLKGKLTSAETRDALATKRKDPKLDALVTDNEYLAIHAYTKEHYSAINGELRKNGHVPDNEWHPVVTDADSGLKKMAENGYLHDGTVIRDVYFTPEQHASLFPDGGVFTEKGFTSSTHNLAGVFPGDTRLVIENSKKGIGVGDVSFFGNLESEVLYRPGQQFDVVSKTFDPALKKTVIVLRERP